MKNEKYGIKVIMTSQCPMGAKACVAIDDLAVGEKTSFKVIISSKKVMGRWLCYLDEEKKECAIGGIDTLQIDGIDYRGKDIDEEMPGITGNSYVVSFDRHDDKFLYGTISMEKTVSSFNSENESVSDEIAAVIEEKITAGIVSRNEIEKRVAYMQRNGVDEFLMYRVLKGYRTYKRETRIPSTVYEDPYLTQTLKLKKEGIVSKGLRQAVARQGSLKGGPKSCGKNVYIETIAWLMNMPLYLITFNRQMSPASVFGDKTTDNSAAELLENFDEAWIERAKEVRMKYNLSFWQKAVKSVCGVLLKAVNPAAAFDLEPKLTEEEKEILRKEAEFEKLTSLSSSVHIKMEESELFSWLEDGGIMCFNEINMADSNFLASFANQILDGTGSLYVNGHGNVPISPDAVLTGTFNENYEGTNVQNDATMSRFNCTQFKQPESIKLQLKAAVRAGLHKDGFSHVEMREAFFDEAEKFYKACQKSATDPNPMISDMCLNIRGYIRALILVGEADGHATLKEYLGECVINTCEVDERDTLYGLLASIVTL